MDVAASGNLIDASTQASEGAPGIVDLGRGSSRDYVPMSDQIFFNAQHSPIGAFASFTVGAKGPRGGLGLELGGPADESIYVGVEDRDTPGLYRALPFFKAALETPAEDYDVEGLSDFQRADALSPFSDNEITREFGAAI